MKLTLALERYRRNGDFPSTITIKGTDEDGKEIVKTMPFAIASETTMAATKP